MVHLTDTKLVSTLVLEFVNRIPLLRKKKKELFSHGSFKNYAKNILQGPIRRYTKFGGSHYLSSSFVILRLTKKNPGNYSKILSFHFVALPTINLVFIHDKLKTKIDNKTTTTTKQKIKIQLVQKIKFFYNSMY